MARRPDPTLADHYRSMLPLGLGFLNDRLRDGRHFIAGDRPTIADCTLAAALDFGRRRGVPLDDEYAGVAAWFGRYRARAVVRQIMAP